MLQPYSVRYRIHRDVLAVAIACAVPSGVVAAGTPGQEQEAGPAVTLDSVKVTATHREEPLRKVPIAVSVVDGEQLERDNRGNVAALVAQVPALNFRAGASNKDTSLFVRGIGTISTSPGVEPSVSTVVDGVVYGRPGQATLELLDVERIEVLRGPQGTLFGKNASAGVLNVVSRPASDQASGFVEFGRYGGGDENRARFGIGGSLLPGLLKASFTGLLGRFDGNVRNVRDGEQINGYDHRGGRARFDLTPSDNLRATLIADYVKSSDDTPNGVVTRTTSDAFANALLPVAASADNRWINSDYRTHVDDINKGVSLQLDWDFSGYTLTSISAWRDWSNTQYQDGDRLGKVSTAFPSSHDVGVLHYTQYSQELRLASPRGGFLDYVVGLYGFHGRDREVYRRTLTSVDAVNTGVADYGTDNVSYAAFGEATLHFSESLRGVVGARYTHDKVEYEHRRVSSSATTVTGIQPSTASAGSTNANRWSGRLGLQYDFGANTMGYLTWSRGYKGPAYNVFFNMQPRDTPALKPETSSSWELGLKSSTQDGRLSANVALFHADYDNYQANFYDTVAGQVVTRLINAGSVSTQGLELDLGWHPLQRLSLTAELAWTHARIKHFNCPGAAGSSCDVDGKPLPFSPDLKASLRADYVVPLRNGLAVELGGDFSWQDQVQYDLSQNTNTIQGAYGIWNASVALADHTHGWRVAVLARNLGNKSYAPLLATGTDYVYRLVPRDDRRYFGVQLRKDF